MNDNKLIIYKSGDIVDAFYKDETLWLSQKRMSELFDVGQPAIAKHLINIYNEKELYKDSTYSKMELVQKEGTSNFKRNVEFYNLDAIIF